MAKARISFPQSENRLLALLPSADYQRILPLLQTVPLKLRKYSINLAMIDSVYFPISGVLSAMMVMLDGSAIEVATIGNEGVAGLTAFMGGETSPFQVMVQVEGRGLRMNADVFKREVNGVGALRRLLVRYNTAFATQVSYAVACNGLHTVEKRCCRWLLMTQDRVRSTSLPRTHELLAIMLGVQRASVTEVLRPLQSRRLIRNHRGKIEILDGAGLKKHACECYQAVNDEFDRLFKAI